MPLFNTAKCDCGCDKELFLGGPRDEDIPGAEEILQVTDANSQKFIFLSAECFKKWAAKYECPYKRPKHAEFIPLDAILPGTREN